MNKLIKKLRKAFAIPCVSTRYFMVFYSANHERGFLNGQTSFYVTGENPFLNKIQVEKYLSEINPDAKNFVINGFNEIKKHEYERWLSNEY